MVRKNELPLPPPRPDTPTHLHAPQLRAPPCMPASFCTLPTLHRATSGQVSAVTYLASTYPTSSFCAESPLVKIPLGKSMALAEAPWDASTKVDPGRVTPSRYPRSSWRAGLHIHHGSSVAASKVIDARKASRYSLGARSRKGDP